MNWNLEKHMGRQWHRYIYVSNSCRRHLVRIVGKMRQFNNDNLTTPTPVVVELLLWKYMVRIFA